MFIEGGHCSEEEDEDEPVSCATSMKNINLYKRIFYILILICFVFQAHGYTLDEAVEVSDEDNSLSGSSFSDEETVNN